MTTGETPHSLKDQLEELGHLFDVMPSQVAGNNAIRSRQLFYALHYMAKPLDARPNKAPIPQDIETKTELGRLARRLDTFVFEGMNFDTVTCDRSEPRLLQSLNMVEDKSGWQDRPNIVHVDSDGPVAFTKNIGDQDTSTYILRESTATYRLPRGTIVENNIDWRAIDQEGYRTFPRVLCRLAIITSRERPRLYQRTPTFSIPTSTRSLRVLIGSSSVSLTNPITRDTLDLTSRLSGLFKWESKRGKSCYKKSQSKSICYD